jgi:hypothetical protein
MHKKTDSKSILKIRKNMIEILKDFYTKKKKKWI